MYSTEPLTAGFYGGNKGARQGKARQGKAREGNTSRRGKGPTVSLAGA